MIADDIAAELRRKLPLQRKTQRNNLALLVATMLDARSANLMDLAAALPRNTQSADMRYQWITRVLGNPRIDPDAVMTPFAGEVLRHEAEAGYVMLILNQSKLADRHQVLMLALRYRDRALPLAWRVQVTENPIGFAVQLELIQAVASWLPQDAIVWLMADGFECAPSLICLCRAKGWGYQLRLKNTPSMRHRLSQFTSTASHVKSATHYLRNTQLTVLRVNTNDDIINDSGDSEPSIIARYCNFGYFPTLDNSRRWDIQGMFPEFQSRGFGIEHTRLHYPDRLARLLLVMTLALYSTVSEGSWD